MKSIKSVVFLLLLLTQFSAFSQSLYEVPVEEITNKSSIIVEGKVVSQLSFWNTQHTMIYTENKILVFKSFKGTLSDDTIKVITVGGQVGNSAIVASDLLDLNLNDFGLFYCTPNVLKIKSPQDQSVLLDVYSSQQGFVKYDLNTLTASTPFKKYSSITNNLYQAVEAKTGGRFKTIHGWNESPEQFRATAISALGISSFSPTTVNAGALLDPTNNLLTITGTDFGDASGSAAVYFDDANDGTGGTPWTVAYNDPLIVSWSNTEIKIRVPQRAGTGTIGVTNSTGSSVTSSSSLTVRYSVMTFGFSSGGTSYIKEANLMNANTLGGYTINYSTNTAGGGVDLDASAAKATFQRALNTWKEISGYNITEGGTTTNQAIGDDGINTILYDNTNTGISPLADGVLGVCYSYFTINATYVSDFTSNQAYRKGFDISIRNAGVSTGSVQFTLGPCPPNATDYNLTDLETVLLHELGHSIGLGHINDAYVGSIGAMNPGKLMNYAVVNSAKRVSPDYAAKTGAAYLIQPQGNTYGGSNTEMTPLSTTLESKDDCPTTLPSTALATNTAISFDMVHATSNLLTDPAYTNLRCDGVGASLTNNAYYAFKTGSTASSTLTITVSGYGTIPAALASCTQAYGTIPVTGFRMAIYNVSGGLPTSPSGYGSPVACREFTANGALTNFTGLAANTEYLILVEGIENTKANFTFTFTGTATAQQGLTTLGLTSSTPATVAYSVRQLSTGYSGPLMRIRNSTSGDTYDVWPDASGNFSSTSVISAANPGTTPGTKNGTTALSTIISSTTFTVAIWYDQSGNGTNLTQTTATDQPRIINNGTIDTENSKPFIRFYGTPGTSTLNSLNLPSALTTNGHVSVVNKFVSGGDGFIFGANSGYNWHSNGGALLLISLGSTSVKSGSVWQNGTSISGVNAVWNTSLGINTLQPQTANSGTSWDNIGKDRGTGHHTSLGGGYAELVVFASALSTTEKPYVETSQGTYFAIDLTNTPIISVQPSTTAQTLCLNGTPSNLSVTASVTNATINYQWYSNATASNTSGSLIGGATNSSYTPNTSASGATYYYCVLTNSTTGSTITSNVSGAVTVRAAFTTGAISTTGQTICSGGTPTIIGSTTASSGGNESITYTWRSSADSYASAIGGATSATYTPPAGLTTTTSYRRYAKDGTCSTTPTVSTGTWMVTITAAPTTANAGPDQTGSATCESTTKTLAGNTASAGTGTWSIISGTGGTITTPSSATSTFSGTAGSSYTLRWTISNGCTASTDDVVITFNATATPILGTYAGTSIQSGQSATITPSAAPSNTTTIVAYSTTNFKGTFTVNPTTGVLTVNNAKHAGTYTVTVKAFNSAGCSSTTTFNLTVSNPNISSGTFAVKTDLNVDVNPTSLAIGDFNEDGKQDIAAANEGAASVSIRLGNGTGGFTGSTNVSVGNNPRSIAIGDFNGDGHLDIATANAGASSVSIRLGDGSGGFSGSTELSVGINTSAIALGDFNKDGALDIITANPEAHAVSVLLGIGNGGFGDSSDISVGDYPYSLAVGDFNGDGNPDFAAANYFSNDVSLRLGDGSGNFSVGTNVSVGNIPTSVTIGDFNGDGNQDIATTAEGSDSVSIRLGDGNGGFSGSTSISVGSQPWFVTVGDFNGDGKQDIATANNGASSVSIRLGDGSGGFSGSTNLSADGSPRAVAIGDFNGDGKQDVASANVFTSSVSILLGADNEINIKGNAVSIVDGDNSPSTSDNTDLGNTCIAGTIIKTFTIENTGTAALQLNSGAITATGTNASMFAVGGIILPTSIAAGSSTTFTVTFTPTSVGTKTATIHIASDDADEGDYDFAMQGAAVTTIPTVTLGTYTATSVIVSQNTTITPTAAPSNSTSIFAYSTTNFSGTLTVNSSTGVLNVTNAKQVGTFPITLKASNSVGCSVNTTLNLTVTVPVCSQGTFTSATNVGVAAAPTGVAIGDFNEDGKQDIATANEVGSSVSIRLGDGFGGFTGSTDVSVGLTPKSLAIADFNRDGHLDFATANNGASSVSIRLGDGSGGFSGSTELTVGNSASSIAIGDFNKDGALDIITANPNALSVSVLLGNGNGEFGSSSEISVGNFPFSVAVGDFNGDGNPDFATANYISSDVSIRLGDGSGNFSVGSDVSVGDNPYSVTIGDFNRDGNQDLATTSDGASSVSIRLGDGNGGFSGSTSISVGSQPWFINIGYFNADSYLDIVTADNGSDAISLLLGDGNGGFGSRSVINVGAYPRSIAMGDFNGDGRQDIAVANSNSDMVSILLGDGNDINIKGNSVSIADGDNTSSTTDNTDFGIICITSTIDKTFTIENTGTTALQLNSGAITVTGTDASKFTISGITLPASIAAGNSTTFTVTFTPSSAGTKTATIHVASDDCDEADYDFAVQGAVVSTIPPATLGTYTATSVFVGQNTTITPITAPSNSTSIFAYSTTNFSGIFTVNPTTGVLNVTNAKQVGTFPVTLKALNTVGCSVNTTFNLTVTAPVCSQGTLYGTIATNVKSVGNIPAAVAIGDFNGDGKQDIVTANHGETSVSILLGDGSGGFSDTSNVSVGGNPYAVAIGDFNGDNKQDIAIANRYSASVSIRLGDGSGNFSGTTEVSVGNGPNSITIGDFNGDGYLDFATANYDSNTVSIRLGNGSGGFSGNTEVSVGSRPYSIAIGDFNEDGNQDIASTNRSSASVSILLGDGLGNFSSTADVNVGNRPYSIAIGDFNGDGHQDIATANYNSYTVSIRLGDGNGNFSGTTDLSIGYQPHRLAIGYFNADGYLDIVTANNSVKSVSVLLGDGSGGFGSNTYTSGYSSARSVAIGDFNGDGNQDIAVTNENSNSVSILLGSVNEINIKGNAVSIADGDNTSSTTDNTDFGSTCVAGTIDKTFTIENTGTTALQLNSGAITVTGTNASMFTISGITLPASIAAGASTTFTVTFTPSSAGTKTATIHVASDDCDEADYDFAVQGIGNELTTANAGTDQTGATTCGLTSVTLAGNTPTAGTGAWSIVSGTGGTITTASSATSTFSGVAGSTYTLRWTISNGSCTASTDDVVVTFNQAPTAGITNNSATTVLTCTTSTISLTATGGVSYSWSNGTSVVGTSAALSVMIPATYTVTVTGASGCTATSAVTITQTGAVPTIAIANSAGTTVLSCTNKTTTLTASGSSYYYWTKNGVIVSTNAALTVTTPGTYIATGTPGSGGCSGSNSVTITQNTDLPVASITNNTGATQVDCINTAISLTATGGTSYLWSDGSTSANLSVSAAGTYTVTVTNSGSGCTSTSSIAITKNISASTAATLSGSTTITSGGSANLKVAITGGQAPFTITLSGGTVKTNYYPLQPTIAVSPTTTTSYTLVSVVGSNGCTGTGNSGTAAVVTVSTPGTTSWTGSVSRLWNVGGNWSAGTIPNENDAITIGTNANQPQLNIDFTVGGSLTLSGTGTTLTVNAGKSLSVASGATVDFGSKEVTFKSDATGTAQLGRMQGTLSNASNVVVERYFPATNRAYRFISASLNTTSTMKYNWMENATAGTTAGYPFAAATATNPTAGYGTQITGTGGNTNGFDATATNGASIYSFSNLGQAWSALANTSGTFAAGDAYRILIRGDRGIDLNSSAPTVTATTLRTRGTLKTGTHTVSALSSAWGGWNLIGNPYNAQIDMRGVSATNMTASYTVWDPTRGTRGAYVVYNYGTGVSSNFGSAVNELLQPGQAFFVQTDNPGAATFTFEEVDKTPAGTQTSVFSPLTVYPVLNSALYYTDSLAKNKPEMDAFAVVFDNNFSDNIDREDGQKYGNSDENMSVKRNGSLLALELRSMYNGGTIIPINITDYKRQNYTMRLKWNNPVNAGYDAKLIDNYNGAETAINVSGNTDYVYTVNSSIPGSIAADRFKIVFVPNAALPVSGLTLTGAAKGNAVALQYEALNERDMQVYAIERSADGTVFTKLGEQQPVNGTAASNRYNYTDNNPLAGVNYYRIKGSSINGQLQYSNVITVKTGNMMPTVIVAPNPIVNKVLNLKLSQLTKGSYRMIVTDVAGRTIYSKEMVYDGVSSAIKTSLPSNLKPGNYYVRLSGEGNDFTEKFIIQ